MKLYRFTAANSETAMMMVNESLGSDALIYSTRKILDGIEVLAGSPFTEIKVENVPAPKGRGRGRKKKPTATLPVDQPTVVESCVDNLMLENFCKQLARMNEDIQILSTNLNILAEVFDERAPKKFPWKVFLQYLINYFKGIYANKIFNR